MADSSEANASYLADEELLQKKKQSMKSIENQAQSAK